MNSDHDTDALEALARGELVADRAGLDAHLSRCDECTRELAWLRAERRLVREREGDAPELERLWHGVAARLPAATPAGPSPYRVASLRAPEPTRRPWRAFAAGFAAAAVLGLGVAALTLTFSEHQASPQRTRHRPAHAPARGRVEAALTVSEPVRLRVETWGAHVSVSTAQASEIRVVARGVVSEPRITRRADGRYDLTFDHGRLSRGEVEVAVPRESGVEVSTAAGDISLGEGLGEVSAASTSGEVRAMGVRDAQVTTSSGDIVVVSSGPRVRVRSVSGDARIEQRAATTVDVESTSGDVSWSGSCARDCHMEVRSVSGDVHLSATSESAFTLGFGTVSGELTYPLRRGVTQPASGDQTELRFGTGEGSVRVTTTSGSLTIAQP